MAGKSKKAQAPEGFEEFVKHVKKNIGEASIEVLTAWFEEKQAASAKKEPKKTDTPQE